MSEYLLTNCTSSTFLLTASDFKSSAKNTSLSVSASLPNKSCVFAANSGLLIFLVDPSITSDTTYLPPRLLAVVKFLRIYLSMTESAACSFEYIINITSAAS